MKIRESNTFVKNIQGFESVCSRSIVERQSKPAGLQLGRAWKRRILETFSEVWVLSVLFWLKKPHKVKIFKKFCFLICTPPDFYFVLILYPYQTRKQRTGWIWGIDFYFIFLLCFPSSSRLSKICQWPINHRRLEDRLRWYHSPEMIKKQNRVGNGTVEGTLAPWEQKAVWPPIALIFPFSKEKGWRSPKRIRFEDANLQTEGLEKKWHRLSLRVEKK